MLTRKPLFEVIPIIVAAFSFVTLTSSWTSVVSVSRRTSFLNIYDRNNRVLIVVIARTQRCPHTHTHLNRLLYLDQNVVSKLLSAGLFNYFFGGYLQTRLWFNWQRVHCLVASTTVISATVPSETGTYVIRVNECQCCLNCPVMAMTINS